MDTNPFEITFDVELLPGEPLTLPEEAAGIVGPGHWQVSIRPGDPTAPHRPARDHSAFLNGYAPEDEGLYDDYTGG